MQIACRLPCCYEVASQFASSSLAISYTRRTMGFEAWMRKGLGAGGRRLDQATREARTAKMLARGG